MAWTLDDFDYKLPEELIAQEPARPRDRSRLLVYDRGTGKITDERFYNLPQYLPRPTTLVLNNSRVDKDRLLFDAKEILLLEKLDEHRADALVRPGKRFREGRTVALDEQIQATVEAVHPDGTRRMRFNCRLDDPALDRFRHTPFPPYIRQNEALSEHYQTVYASTSGSKAAPTAGLHFTRELFDRLQAGQVGIVEVTLHVGLGTFAPVSDQDLKAGKLHEEQFHITRQAAGRLSSAGHITAVGTTSARVLESAAGPQRRFESRSGSTDLFIQPGYRFRAVDSLVTNFHLPRSSLLMLVSAFMGYEEMMRVYRHAIADRYRFFSFGDAMLIR